MTKPGFEAQEDGGQIAPLLIIDKQGSIGSDLAKSLCSDFVIVYASATRFIPSSAQKEQIVFIPFYKERKKLPKLPSNTYHAIVVVWNGESEIKDRLPEFVTKARADNAKLLVIAPYTLSQHAALADLLREYRNSSVVLVGDVFPTPMGPAQESAMQHILASIQSSGRIVVAGDGLRKTYPIALEDVRAGIIEVLFGTHRRSRIFFLFPQYPPTSLGVARMLQKIDPDIRVDFTKATKEQSVILPAEGTYIGPSQKQLEHRLAEVLATMPRAIQPSVVTKPPPRKRFSWHGKYLFISLLFGIFLIALPTLVTLGTAVGGVMLLKNAQHELSRSNNEAVVTNLALSHQLFAFAQKSSHIVGIEASLVGRGDIGDTLGQSLQTASLLSSVLSDATNAQQLFTTVFAGTSRNPRADFTNATHLVKRCVEGIEQVNVLQAEQPWMAPLFGDELQTVRPALQLLASVVDILPQLAGVEGKKTYLVLFQNNMELRPGGGFIGSYGVVTLEQGRVKAFHLHDVYDADGQLKGHIEPPFPIRRYMGIVHGYLRDSNFSPDFPTNAKNAAFFLEQETGQRVDGVVAVDVSFVDALLKITGPVFVSDYNETVSDKNFYLKTQAHAEKNFFPGSTQKRQFLTSLFLSLQQRLEDKKGISYKDALRVVTQAILEKHILMAVADQHVQQLLATNNFSSAMPQEQPITAGTIEDFLGISEANIGANKANFYVKRTIAKETTVGEDGTITSVLKLMYENTSTAQSAFGGDYKNYVRLIVPVGATLATLTIDGQDMPIQPAVTDFAVYEQKRFTPPPGIEVEQSVAFGKTIFGFLLPVPGGKKRTVEVSYTLAQHVTSEPALTYTLQLFKQPGTNADPFSLSLSVPKAYRVLQASRGSEVTTASDTLWNFPLTSDTLFTVQLAKH